jgi:hypothetical protein
VFESTRGQRVSRIQPASPDLMALGKWLNDEGLETRGASDIDDLAKMQDWVRRHWIHGDSLQVDFNRFDARDIFAPRRPARGTGAR